ncbi:MAG: hypothetical protein IKG66_01560 [Lachnospiraceae bacterium]|nr:hypothetical protein [Lachnospiraceae bacterium]
MAFNPMELLKLKERLDIFRQQHPRVHPFLSEVRGKALQPGSVLEIRVTDPEGKEYVSNIRVTPEDVETIGLLMSLRGQ